MLFSRRLASALALPLLAAGSPPLVTSVTVPGTNLQVNLATQVGRPYDAAAVERDVRYLWSLGRFEDIRVEASDAPGGTAVVFRVRAAPALRLHEIRIEPSAFGLRMKLPEGSPIDAARAREIASEARKRLEARGFANARVDYRFARCRDEVDLILKADPGDAVRVKAVEFDGETGIDRRELERSLRALRPRRILPGIPHLWNGWRLLPGYSREVVDADAARLQSLYLAKGYFDASVSAGDAEIHGADARVKIAVRAGPRFTMRSLSIGGRPAALSTAALCGRLFAERRDAERRGVLDFSATMRVRESAPAVADASVTVTLGRPYRVGRIEFTGNHHFSDAAVRRNLAIDEGAPLDERLLRRSMGRLNRAGMFEAIDERNVLIQRNEKTGTADIRLSLQERKAGMWNISGPVGPASVAGPLEASISTRLPAWGRGLLELPTYTASVSVLAFAKPLIPALPAFPRVPVLAIGRPFTPGQGWLSGFSFAPQLGWQAAAAGYAMTQLRQRLLPLLNGDYGLVPDLPVTVNRPSGDAVMVCEPPRPRLALPRALAANALNIFGALAAL